MKEIPLFKVRANQLGIVIVIALAIILQLPWLIAIAWLVQILTRFLGSGANAFVLVFEPITKLIYGDKNTEAEELQRFNLALAITFLSLSLISFSLNWTLAGYIIGAVMGLCALMALFGFCLGCTMYFQIKKYKALRDRKQNV